MRGYPPGLVTHYICVGIQQKLSSVCRGGLVIHGTDQAASVERSDQL